MTAALLIAASVLVIGDSVSLRAPEWWPAKVESELGGDWTVVSQFGWGTERWISPEGRALYLPYADADEVHILLGLNDGRLGLSDTDYRANLESLVEPLAGTVWVHLTWDGAHGSLEGYRDAIREPGPWLVGADLSGIDRSWLPDEIHPVEAGQDWIAGEIVHVVPEPATATLLLAGLLERALRARRERTRRRSVSARRGTVSEAPGSSAASGSAPSSGASRERSGSAR